MLTDISLPFCRYQAVIPNSNIPAGKSTSANGSTLKVNGSGELLTRTLSSHRGQAARRASGITCTDCKTHFTFKKLIQLLQQTEQCWNQLLGCNPRYADETTVIIKACQLLNHSEEITHEMNLPSLSSSWILRYKYSSPLPFLPCSAPCILAISVVLPEPSSPASKFLQEKEKFSEIILTL